MRVLLLALPLLAGCELIGLYQDAFQCDEGTHAVDEECVEDEPPYVIPGEEDTATDDSGADDSASDDSAADDSNADSSADDTAA